MLTKFLRQTERLSGSLLGGVAVSAEAASILVCLIVIVFGSERILELAAL